jgi:hypothetical protein
VSTPTDSQSPAADHGPVQEARADLEPGVHPRGSVGGAVDFDQGGRQLAGPSLTPPVAGSTTRSPT